VHTAGLLPTQAPPLQVSVCVHPSLSLHETPSSAVTSWMQPAELLQLSAVQAMPSLQSFAAGPAHLPAAQMSPVVHALPSSHEVPSTMLGVVQVPDVVTQTPATWHWSSAVHTTGLLPAQLPPLQVSDCVQKLPSLHVVPFSAVLS